MSKIGKKPITIVENVTLSENERRITVNGPKGTLSFAIPQGINVVIEEKVVLVSQVKETQDTTKAFFGLTRAMIANMVHGVSQGFEKKLEMSGVGYRAQVSGSDLNLSLGYSHPVKITAPEGVKFIVADNVITIAGIDNALIGTLAAKIRALKPPEPYKGKGIKYVGEKIRRKAGKAAKAVGGK